MIRLRPALWPTLISLPIFVLSVGLGVWQMERRAWKRDILDRIATNQASAPITLDELLKGDPLRFEYGRVRVSGTFLHDKEMHLAARSLKNKVGMHVVTPLRTDDGKILLFDRGWIPSEKKAPEQRAEGQLPGKVDYIKLRDLRVGDAVADLAFYRRGKHVSIEVDRCDGELQVIVVKR